MKPIDINIVYNEIVEKLKTSNNTHIITELERSSAGAATGSEALIDQGSYLLSLKNKNLSVFRLLENQINTYIEYCRENGLIIR